MKCQGCVNVTENSAVKGVDKVQVDLKQTSQYRRKPRKWSLKRALKGTKFGTW